MLTLKKLVFIVLMIIAASLGGAKAYIDHQLHLKLNTSIKSVADKVTINYSEIHTSLLGSVIIHNLQLIAPSHNPVHINAVTIHKAHQFYSGNLPEQIEISIEGFQYPISDRATPIPPLMSTLGYAPYYLSLRELRNLGYTVINADIHLKAKFNGEQMSWSGTIKANIWGNLRFLINLTPVPVLAEWKSWIKKVQLTAFVLSYTNQGLVNRVFAHLAQRNAMTVDRFKHTLITKIESDLNQAKVTLDSSVLGNLRQFIQTPVTLTIHLQPSPPLTLTLNTLFSTSPKHLGLKMTTTELKE